MANKSSAKTEASLTSQLASLQAKLQATETTLQERTKLLEYVANLLLEINAKFASSPILNSLPKKFNFWWLLSNWRSVLEFIEFVILKIKEFIQNVKVERNPNVTA